MRKVMKIGLAALLAIGVLGTIYGYATTVVPQKSVLTGRVVSVVSPGTAVKEGDVLVTVTSLAGPVPAVRADVDGVVKEVLVNQGENIEKQDTAVIIESK
jgi:hypothetical protein